MFIYVQGIPFHTIRDINCKILCKFKVRGGFKIILNTGNFLYCATLTSVFMLLYFKCKPLCIKRITSFFYLLLYHHFALKTVLKQRCKTVMQLESLLMGSIQGYRSPSCMKFLAIAILIEAFKGK
jgi:hypothetical protein